MNEPNAKDWAEFKQHADRFYAARRAFEGFPAERLGNVQEGDFAEALLFLHFYYVHMAARYSELETEPPLEHQEAGAYLARLQPEQED